MALALTIEGDLGMSSRETLTGLRRRIHVGRSSERLPAIRSCASTLWMPTGGWLKGIRTALGMTARH